MLFTLKNLRTDIFAKESLMRIERFDVPLHKPQTSVFRLFGKTQGNVNGQKRVYPPTHIQKIVFCSKQPQK